MKLKRMPTLFLLSSLVAFLGGVLLLFGWLANRSTLVLSSSLERTRSFRSQLLDGTANLEAMDLSKYLAAWTRFEEGIFQIQEALFLALLVTGVMLCAIGVCQVAMLRALNRKGTVDGAI